MGTYHLSINTGFAVNRYTEPEEWLGLIGGELGVRHVQLTADLLPPTLPASALSRYVARTVKACQANGTAITSTFTGAFTRVNHLAHPDAEVRAYWVDWFKKFADLTADLGAKTMGSHFGIFTYADDRDPLRREARRRQNIEGWHEVAAHAKTRGIQQLTWEPMSISREQGETIAETRRLQADVNRGAPLPFGICLDVDHGDLTSPDPRDTDPFAWIEAFAAQSPQVHLKQSSANKGGHWPFIEPYNTQGRIDPARIVAALDAAGAGDTELILELSFREREPADSSAPAALKGSVEFWRARVPQVD